MTSLLAAAVISAAGLLPLPVPLTPPAEPTAQEAPAVQVSGYLQAADGRLKKGCKDYQFLYSVTTETEDWSFDISVKDRHGRGVNAQSLIGPNDAKAGVLTYRLCRWATVPGIFTMTGLLTSDDYAEETSVAVTESFRLRRRNR